MPNPYHPRRDEVCILVAEDDADDREILVDVVREAGLRVVLVFVHDGQELKEYLREMPMTKPIRFPDLILLDVNMPRVDGMEALRFLKSNPDTNAIPAAMLSTGRDPRLIDEAMRLGACKYYVKPSHIPAYKSLLCDMLAHCVRAR